MEIIGAFILGACAALCGYGYGRASKRKQGVDTFLSEIEKWREGK